MHPVRFICAYEKIDMDSSFIDEQGNLHSLSYMVDFDFDIMADIYGDSICVGEWQTSMFQLEEFVAHNKYLPLDVSLALSAVAKTNIEKAKENWKIAKEKIEIGGKIAIIKICNIDEDYQQYSIEKDALQYILKTMKEIYFVDFVFIQLYPLSMTHTMDESKIKLHHVLYQQLGFKKIQTNPNYPFMVSCLQPNTNKNKKHA